MDALDKVEADGDFDDPGAGDPAMGEEAEARPEGPPADHDDLPGEGETLDEDSGGFDLFEWATDVPDGSHTEFSISDFWDTDNGGLTRIGFHLPAFDGGYPNALGVVIGLCELYKQKLEEKQGDGGGGDGEKDAPAADTVSKADAEALT
jgi:hypothetical protein